MKNIDRMFQSITAMCFFIMAAIAMIHHKDHQSAIVYLLAAIYWKPAS